jgi:hypothetical protein
MREIRYYVADDGERFNTERECVEYEQKSKLRCHKDEFKIFDCNRRELNIDDECVTQDDVFYIIIKSPAAADVIGEWFEYYGAENPFDDCGGWRNAVGTWVYNDDFRSEGSWYKVEKRLDELQSIIAELKGE